VATGAPKFYFVRKVSSCRDIFAQNTQFGAKKYHVGKHLAAKLKYWAVCRKFATFRPSYFFKPTTPLNFVDEFADIINIIASLTDNVIVCLWRRELFHFYRPDSMQSPESPDDEYSRRTRRVTSCHHGSVYLRASLFTHDELLRRSTSWILDSYINAIFWLAGDEAAGVGTLYSWADDKLSLYNVASRRSVSGCRPWKNRPTLQSLQSDIIWLHTNAVLCLCHVSCNTHANYKSPTCSSAHAPRACHQPDVLAYCTLAANVKSTSPGRRTAILYNVLTEAAGLAFLKFENAKMWNAKYAHRRSRGALRGYRPSYRVR